MGMAGRGQRRSQSLLRQAIEKGRAWLWRDGLGALVIGEDSDDDGLPVPIIELLGCPLEHLPAMLLDYRRLAAAQGYQQAGWVASLHPDLQPYLAGAGFRPRLGYRPVLV